MLTEKIKRHLLHPACSRDLIHVAAIPHPLTSRIEIRTLDDIKLLDAARNVSNRDPPHLNRETSSGASCAEMSRSKPPAALVPRRSTRMWGLHRSAVWESSPPTRLLRLQSLVEHVPTMNAAREAS